MKYIYEIMGFAVLVWPLTLLVLIGLGAIIAGLLSAFIAKKTGRSGGKWFLIVIGTVIVFVFWDWPLTVMAHKYYCEKEAGFWVYKTLEQWKAENPGVYETLKYNDSIAVIPTNAGHKIILSRFNDHFALNSSIFYIGVLGIKKHEILLNDISKNINMAKFADFSVNFEYSGLIDKFWLRQKSCGNKKNYLSMIDFYEQFKGTKK